MPDTIVNRVAKSPLIVFDLEEYYPEGKRMVLDIKDWLFEGIILKEKEFRQSVTDHDWEQYRNAYVAVGCSTDAIIPGWAYMLVASHLQSKTKKTVIGGIQQLETAIFQGVIGNIDLEPFRDKPVIIKGCANKSIPENAYVWATQKIQQVAKSIMYGEACSSVPIYKRK